MPARYPLTPLVRGSYRERTRRPRRRCGADHLRSRVRRRSRQRTGARPRTTRGVNFRVSGTASHIRLQIPHRNP
ncbi:MAG: hypothetical protein ACREV7_11425 [Steroidobacteraceae bacterium]